jgi:predicted nucleic acid-binding protein
MGETSVLGVALERSPATAVLDDAAARTCAKALGIDVIGTLGVVLRAKIKGIIPSAAEVLKSLRAAGLHLDEKVAIVALKGIGETWE